MLSNKKNFSSASNIFFQSRQISLPAWQQNAQNAQHAAKKLAELNTAAALALLTESRAAFGLCLLADSPQALLALALTQAQAHVAKAQSYARHWSAIISSIGGDEIAEMKMASGKLSLLSGMTEKKLPAVASPALTLSDGANMTPGSAVPRLKLASFDVANVTDVTDVTDVTETGAPIAGSGDGAPGSRHH
jgi:hypothetical protein